MRKFSDCQKNVIKSTISFKAAAVSQLTPARKYAQGSDLPGGNKHHVQRPPWRVWCPLRRNIASEAAPCICEPPTTRPICKTPPVHRLPILTTSSASSTRNRIPRSPLLRSHLPELQMPSMTSSPHPQDQRELLG